MKKLILSIACVLFMSGCITTTKIVYVPVPAQCAVPPEINKTELFSVFWIPPTDNKALACVDEENGKALISDIMILRSELQQCESALDVYRNQPK